jgi:FkbM family methyltransferase
MPFVSYAQNCEDVLLYRVFGGQGTGFYVDVGAFDPVNGSTTKAFYDRGWSGINVEPGSVFAELATARPRDVNLQLAVTDRSGEIAFIENAVDRGASCVAPDANGTGAVRMVPCDTLEAVVRAHSDGRVVDFVKVDAEGSEPAIVRSTDWRSLRPRVLLIRATRSRSSALVYQEWEPDLLRQGFVRVYFDGINCFYVPEEEVAALAPHFQTPVNVLDHFERYETSVLRAAVDARQQEAVRAATERDALQAALDDQRNETARVVAERDALRSAGDLQRGEMATSIAAQQALRAATDAEQPATARTAGKLGQWRDEARRFNDAVGNSETRRVSAQSGRKPPPPPRTVRNAARRIASAAYRLVRPIVRPIAWRLRGFMVGGLSEQLRQLNERVGVQPSPSRTSHDGTAATEMYRLAAEMERTLLTLALERAPDRWPAAVLAPRETLATTHRVELLLPHGRVTELECPPNDLAISASLIASGGDWEPHVRRYIETVVQPNWVCLDIGANIGAHTLSLAVLADEGRVVAFEADAANFELLRRNARALEPKHAAIDPVHLALWDGCGSFVCCGTVGLAECSLVADEGADAASVGRTSRRVVSADAINASELDARVDKAPALSLDAWVADNPLPRLDLIKLDVEGAEAQVIRGASETLRLHRPIVIVEYNPAFADAYFGQSPDALFRELVSRFDFIGALEPDGALKPISDWTELEERLAVGKRSENLVCLPSPTPAG